MLLTVLVVNVSLIKIHLFHPDLPMDTYVIDISILSCSLNNLLLSRVSDLIDIVKDPISTGDYSKDEDPKLYISEKTGRGPLTDNWRAEYSAGAYTQTTSRRHLGK